MAEMRTQIGPFELSSEQTLLSWFLKKWSTDEESAKGSDLSKDCMTKREMKTSPPGRRKKAELESGNRKEKGKMIERLE